MAISTSISRLTDYYTRHGFGATIRRAGLAIKRALFSSRMVLFYCDLGQLTPVPVNLPNPLSAERVSTYADLSQRDLQEMTSFWNPKMADRNIRARFEKRASLWLVKSRDKLAGYGWTLRGRTIEPYYFPLGQDDVHLFDFHVFPGYRGQGINPLLVTHILNDLAASGSGRAFIEAAEWNEAQLASLRKTPFRYLGRVKSLTILGRTLVNWVEGDAGGELQEGAERRRVVLDPGMSSKEHGMGSDKKETVDGVS